jgi:hypothetical protein
MLNALVPGLYQMRLNTVRMLVSSDKFVAAASFPVKVGNEEYIINASARSAHAPTDTLVFLSKVIYASFGRGRHRRKVGAIPTEDSAYKSALSQECVSHAWSFWWQLGICLWSCVPLVSAGLVDLTRVG